MSSIAWMAWTPVTAVFFAAIAALLGVFTVLAVKYPETERQGILWIRSTRGDRLFLALLGAAFIHLIFLGLFGADTLITLGEGEGAIEISRLWLASLISLVYAWGVFRYV
jgi:predicted small integral membrane protein